MANHRDTLGRESASRIWRTVVVAGAMLGAPMIASAEAPPSAPPAATEKPHIRGVPPKAPATKAELAKQAAEVVKALAAEMAELDKKITATLVQVNGAKDRAARDTANATLTEQRKQKTELKAKQTAAKAEQKKADTAAKAEADANKQKPRPRTPDEIRPKGRGFILS